MYETTGAKMTRRNGSVIKYVVFGVLFIGCVYFVYLYNDVSGRLTESEKTAEKYRRSEESLTSQLQELSNNKEELRQRCEGEKREFQNRFTSLQQQHKMLKTQNDDLQADYNKLNMERQKENDDQKLQEAQRNQEYMQLKQEKDLEISSLKDQVANIAREKLQLAETIDNLKTQLQNSQKNVEIKKVENNKLQQQMVELKTQLNQDQASINYLQQELQKQQQQFQAKLQAQQQQQQQFPQQGQQGVQNINQNQAGQNLQGQPMGNQLNQNQNLQGVPQLQNVPQNNKPLVQGGPLMQGNFPNVDDNALHGLGNLQHNAVGVQEMQQNQQGDVHNNLNAEEKAKLIDEHQQQHQVGPPVNLANKSHIEAPMQAANQHVLNLKSPDDHEQMKEQEKHPNIQPPNLKAMEDIKYGKESDKDTDKQQPENDAHPIKDKVEPFQQILPPGGGVDDKHDGEKPKTPLVHHPDSNVQPPDTNVLAKPGGPKKSILSALKPPQ